ncbi:hypothetical protein L2E82_47613 [Cichorium intybus]|uniref:Uncharacterized protein n=1 Tax=Cichorium intybus TaxID=13427 RepID=A0ACB8YXH0_CICIN|nr:hypothetical protein L2E82_47613 [Cichorium intybus]
MIDSKRHLVIRSCWVDYSMVYFISLTILILAAYIHLLHVLIFYSSELFPLEIEYAFRLLISLYATNCYHPVPAVFSHGKRAAIVFGTLKAKTYPAVNQTMVASGSLCFMV